MKVLIIEDEAPAFRRLQKILDELRPGIEILEVLDSVEESIKWFKNHNAPDLIFMDIQLSDGISFQIFESIQINTPVIFTTAFDEYMLRAFKVSSIDYLLKPIRTEDLSNSLAKYEQMKSVFQGDTGFNINELIGQIKLDDKKYKTRFLVKQGDKLLSIQTSDIAYFQTKNSIVHLITKSDKSYLLDFNLEELVEQLDPEKFSRVNRQYIIEFSFIKAVHKYHKGKLLVELHSEAPDKIIVSSEKATSFKKWMGD